MTDESFYRMLRGILRAPADFHRHLNYAFSTPPIADSPQKAALLRIMETGSRFEVATALRRTEAFNGSDMVCLLRVAWRADTSIPREVEPHNGGLADREIYSLVVDLGTGQKAERLTQIYNAGARGSAVAEVYLLGEPRAVKRLAELVAHPRSTVRQGASQLCEALSDPRHLDLLGSLVDSDSPEVAATALRVFCNLGTNTHLSYITTALKYPDEEVRLAAIGALARLRPREASQLLTETARDEAPAVRIAAVTALGALGDMSLRQTLLAELNHRSIYHRIGAARGLAALATRRPEADHLPALAALQTRASSARTAGSLARAEPEVVFTNLARILGSQNPGQPRRIAVEAMAEIDELDQAIQIVARVAGVDPLTLIPISTLPIPANPNELECDSLPIPDVGTASTYLSD